MLHVREPPASTRQPRLFPVPQYATTPTPTCVMTFYNNLNDENQFNLGLPFLAKYPTVYSLAAGAAAMACLAGSVAVCQPFRFLLPIAYLIEMLKK